MVLSWISSFSYRRSSLLWGFLPLKGVGGRQLDPGCASKMMQSQLLSVFSTRCFTVACGMDIVEVKSFSSITVRWTTTCFVIGVRSNWSVGLYVTLVISSPLFCTLSTFHGCACTWCHAPSITGLPASMEVHSGGDLSSPRCFPQKKKNFSISFRVIFNRKWASF